MPSMMEADAEDFVIRPGRLRRIAHSAYGLAALFGGWIWFGNTGAALLATWVLLGWPRDLIFIELPERPHFVKLGRLAITWGEGFAGLRKRQRLFRDEVSPEAFARLRREMIRKSGPGARPRGEPAST